MDPVQLVFFNGLQILSEAKDQAGILPGHIGPPSAVGCEEAKQQLTDHASQRDPHLTGQETQHCPDQHAYTADIDRDLAAQVGAEGDFLYQPGGDCRQYHEYDGQKDLKHGDAGHVHGHAYTAEHMAAAADQTIDPPQDTQALSGGPFRRAEARDFQTKLCVRNTGGIYHPAACEEELEAFALEGVPFVAHVHSLVQEHPSVFVQLDRDVAQLGPAHDHAGQVAAGEGQSAAQLAGRDALRDADVADPVDGGGAHEEQPEQQRRTGQDQHGDQLGVALADVDADTGEHFRGDRHIHGHGFVVIQEGLAGAGDHVVVHHMDQIGVDGLLPVGGMELGRGGQYSGHDHDEGKFLNRQLEAAEQGHLQLKSPVLGDLDHIRDRKIESDGELADHAQSNTAKIHLNRGIGLGGAGLGSVEGDVLGIHRQGEGKAFHIVLQPQGNGHGHLAVAIGMDRAVDIHARGRAGGRGRNGQYAQKEHHCQRHHQDALHTIPPFPKMA